MLSILQFRRCPLILGRLPVAGSLDFPALAGTGTVFFVWMGSSESLLTQSGSMQLNLNSAGATRFNRENPL